MKILITYRHFWPDSPPYASMLRSIAKKLVSEGHDVSLVCEQPCYKPTDGDNDRPSVLDVDGIRVYSIARLPLWKKSGLIRSLSKLVFPLRAYLFCTHKFSKKERIDLVWTATIPPVVSGVIGLKLARRYSSDFLYHCQDLYPEIAVHMDMIKPNGFIYRAMKSLEKKTREQASILVSLSEDMKETIEILARPSGETFSEKNEVKKTETSEYKIFKSSDTINIVFAGNMGQFQGLQTVINALSSLGEKGHAIHLAFMGEGKALGELKRLAKNSQNISFHPHLPFEAAKSLIASADYGLVSLEPDIYKFAFPSKTLTYLGLSVPLVVVVEPESQLVKAIEENELGFFSTGNTVEQISAMLMQIITQREKVKTHKSNASKYYDQACSREHLLGKWSEILSDKDPTTEPNRTSQDNLQ